MPRGAPRSPFRAGAVDRSRPSIRAKACWKSHHDAEHDLIVALGVNDSHALLSFDSSLGTLAFCCPALDRDARPRHSFRGGCRGSCSRFGCGVASMSQTRFNADLIFDVTNEKSHIWRQLRCASQHRIPGSKDAKQQFCLSPYRQAETNALLLRKPDAKTHGSL